jgi:hypothetical protein
MLTNRNPAAALGLVILAAAFPLAPAARAQTKHLPPDTEAILTLNVRQVLEADLVKGQKGLLKNLLDNFVNQNEEAQKYLKDLGFDVFRDVDRVTLAVPAAADPSKGLIIAAGRFDAKKLSAVARDAAQAHGDVLKVTRSGQHELIEVTPPGGEGKEVHLALAGPGTLFVAPTKAGLKQALARASGDQEPQLKKEFKELLGIYDKKASLSFLATKAAALQLLAASKDPNVANVARLLENDPTGSLAKVVGFTGSLTLGKDVQFQVGVTAADADTAKEFINQANIGLIGAQIAVAKMARDNPQLAPAMDILRTLKASAQGNTFLIRGHVPPAVIEAALKQAGQNRQP